MRGENIIHHRTSQLKKNMDTESKQILSNESAEHPNSNSLGTSLSLFTIGVLSVFGFVQLNSAVGTPVTAIHVWWYGWVTALSTGFGALPFLFVRVLNPKWLGASNGKMLPLQIP